MPRSLKKIGDEFNKKGHFYPIMRTCPKCKQEYYSLFDKIYIDHMGFCYWPCGEGEPEAEIASENVLALIQVVL